MKSLINYKLLLLLGLILAVSFTNLQAQDLQAQKQKKIEEVREIDKKLNDATADEYDALMEKRKKLEEEIKEINNKLMADAEVMKKINSSKKALNDGNNALRLGQYQEAISQYDKAIKLDSTFYKAHYGKGLAYYRLRQYNDAIKAYQQAAKHNPSYVNSYIEMGRIYDRLGQDDYAISAYKSAVENDPTSAKAYYQLGVTYLQKKKDYNKAAQSFTQATAIDPEYDLAFCMLGVSLTELGRYEEALLALDNAISVTNRKKWEEPYYRKAIAYNKQGQYAKAKSAAEQALTFQKNYAPAAYEAGKAAKALEQYDQAINYFEICAKDRQWKRTADYEIDLIVNREKYGG